MVVSAPPPLHDTDQSVEGGVIDDARARQRRHRRYGVSLIAAGVVIGGLAAGFAGGGGRSTGSRYLQAHSPSAGAGARGSQQATASIPAGAGVAEFGLLGPGVGWIADGDRLDLTRNGGRSWGSQAIGFTANLNYSSSPEPGLITFLPAEGSGKLVMTTNAGRTWSSHAFVPGKTAGALSFLDARQGFALAYTPAAHHDPRASLYETRDGARTWTRIAAVPFTGLISFANPQDGLGGGLAINAGLVDGAAIYRTSNGGRSWTKTPLCPGAVTCEAPHLFRSGRGVVLTTPTVGLTASIDQQANSEVAVYTTRNDGVTWTRHVLPNTPKLTEDQPYIPFSTPDPNDLFAWISPYLYASHNGGISWSRYTEQTLTIAGPPAFFSGIAFANGSYGWYGNGPVIAYTTDGGAHWTQFNHTS